MSRARLVTLAVLVALVGSAVAVAQSFVSHEYVPNAALDDGSALVSASGSSEPAAIVVDGELVPPPTGGALRSSERAMRAQPGDGANQEDIGRRSQTFRPDRVTALPGASPYFEVFTPSITPYKRVTSLDCVVLVAVVPAAYSVAPITPSTTGGVVDPASLAACASFDGASTALASVIGASEAPPSPLPASIDGASVLPPSPIARPLSSWPASRPASTCGTLGAGEPQAIASTHQESDSARIARA